MEEILHRFSEDNFETSRTLFNIGATCQQKKRVVIDWNPAPPWRLLNIE
jgi:hypothetical protein